MFEPAKLNLTTVISSNFLMHTSKQGNELVFTFSFVGFLGCTNKISNQVSANSCKWLETLPIWIWGHNSLFLRQYSMVNWINWRNFLFVLQPELQAVLWVVVMIWEQNAYNLYAFVIWNVTWLFSKTSLLELFGSEMSKTNLVYHSIMSVSA